MYIGRASRGLLWIWICFACVFSFAFEGNLLRFLVVREKEAPVDTFQVNMSFFLPAFLVLQKILDNDLKLIIPGNTLVDYIMRTSPRKVIRQVYNESILQHPTVVRPQWALDMMANGEAAFVVRVFVAS